MATPAAKANRIAELEVLLATADPRDPSYGIWSHALDQLRPPATADDEETSPKRRRGSMAFPPLNLEIIASHKWKWEMLAKIKLNVIGVPTFLPGAVSTVEDSEVAFDLFTIPSGSDRWSVMRRAAITALKAQAGEESATDDFVVRLLQATGFESLNLLIRTRSSGALYTHSKTGRDAKIAANPDVQVLSVGDYSGTAFVRLVVGEDKPKQVNAGGGTIEDTEAQLCANALAAARRNMDVLHTESRLFLVRVFKGLFSFYSAQFSKEYLDNIYEGRDPTAPQVILRYPSDVKFGLDFERFCDRKEILRVLAGMSTAICEATLAAPAPPSPSPAAAAAAAVVASAIV